MDKNTYDEIKRKQVVRDVQEYGHKVSDVAARYGVSCSIVYSLLEAIPTDREDELREDLSRVSYEIIKNQARLSREKEELDILQRAENHFAKEAD